MTVSLATTTTTTTTTSTTTSTTSSVVSANKLLPSNMPAITTPAIAAASQHEQQQEQQQEEASAVVSSNSNNNIEEEEGCSLLGAIFNFTNCIVGAGAIGLGGAMAESGGFVSIVSIVTFAILTKLSLDLIIQLSLQYNVSSYEELGRIAFPKGGGATIIALNKFLYSFGCLIAYVVVIKDNLGPAILNLVQDAGYCTATNTTTNHHNNFLFWQTTESPIGFVCSVLESNIVMTWLTCLCIMLPLCLLRDMRRLASLSALSIASIVGIAMIILYLYWDDNDAIRPEQQQHNTATSSFAADSRALLSSSHEEQKLHFYQDWLQIRPGYIGCLGSFVFCFVSQHTVHLAFLSLKPKLQTMEHWSLVSFYSVTISCILSLTLGLGVYLSFGHYAKSDIFQMYPSIPLIDVAKLLLAITMVLTFPLPFFTCRELLILHSFPASFSPTTTQDSDTDDNEEDDNNDRDGDIGSSSSSSFVSAQPQSLLEQQDHNDDVHNISDLEDHEAGLFSDLEQPLLQQQQGQTGSDWASSFSAAVSPSVQMAMVSALNYALLPDDAKQLKLPFHVAMTVKLWLVVVLLAMAAPSLGDVLNLVGCATGTIIAFIVPGCLSLQLRQQQPNQQQRVGCCNSRSSLLAVLLLLVGGIVGTVGTYFALIKLIRDVL